MAEAPEHQLPNSKGSNLDSTVRETQLVPSPFTNTGLKDVVIFFDDSKEKLAHVLKIWLPLSRHCHEILHPFRPDSFWQRTRQRYHNTRRKKKAYIIFLQPSWFSLVQYVRAVNITRHFYCFSVIVRMLTRRGFVFDKSSDKMQGYIGWYDRMCLWCVETWSAVQLCVCVWAADGSSRKQTSGWNIFKPG